MPPYYLSSASRALYRVFILPTLSRPSLLPQQLAPTLLAPQNVLNTNPTSIQVRGKHYKKKDTARHALSDMYTFDNAIQASTINFIDAKGTFHRNISLSSALGSFDRTTHHLLLLSPGKVDELGRPDPENPPTCKIISKIDLRALHQKKLDIERRTASGNAGTGPSPKNLELNWAIAAGDLKHRVKKLGEFLREGRKVEVLIGPKRRGRVATPAECEDVLEAVRATVADVPGASEPKEADGKLGAVMTLVFEGRKVDKEKEKEGGKDGKRKKDALDGGIA